MALSLEVLVATMFRKNKAEIVQLLNEMKIASDCVVINQCDKDDIERFEYNNHNVTLVYSTERGLSRSRNLALQYARADIVVIADDDVEYVDGYKDIITNAYESYIKYDILNFSIFDSSGRRYYKSKRKLNKLFIGRTNSNQITMKLASVKKIRFNAFFGTGSGYFLHGEEILFLSKCIAERKQIYFIPTLILFRKEKRISTWFHGFDKAFFIDQGAFYYEFSPVFYPLFIFQFAIRKNKLYKSELSLISAIFYMFSGIKKHRKLIRRNYDV
jgi:glycosyltransferase involved in cell wall biosynthesis